MIFVYDPDLHVKVMVTGQNQTCYWSIRFTISFRLLYHLVQVYYITSGCVVDIKQICMSKDKVTGSCQMQMCRENSFSEWNSSLDYRFTWHQCPALQDVSCTDPALVCMFKATGHGQNILNFHDHRPFIVLYDWREPCLLIGSNCLHKSLCLPENRSKQACKLMLHENQLKLVSRS